MEPEEGVGAKGVSAGVVVLRAGAVRPYGSVFVSEGAVVRAANRPRGGEAGVFDTLGVAGGTRVWVNGRENGVLPVGEWVVVSFRILEGEVDMRGRVVPAAEGVDSRVWVMSDGIDFWGRAMEGEVACVVLLGGGKVSDDAMGGIVSALARRHNVKGIPLATAAQVNAARATGFRDFGQWGTLLLISRVVKGVLPWMI